MKKYFENCKTAEELKRAYRETARKLHPDCNPGIDTTEDFKRMQAEFETAFARLKNVHEASGGKTYSKATNETAAEFMDLINKLLKIDGIEVELCGSWIWVTGNTYAARAELKACGMRYSKGKRAWYWHSGACSGRGRMSLDGIRAKYGSQVFDKPSTPAYIGCATGVA